jgi:hypothetical protein
MAAAKSQMTPCEWGMSYQRGTSRPPITHLFPHEAPQSERAALMEAHAKQAKEHDEKEDDVGSEADENVKLGNAQVEHRASIRLRYPSSADLRKNESNKDQVHFRSEYSPARWLVSRHVGLRSLNFCKKEGVAYLESEL